VDQIITVDQAGQTISFGSLSDPIFGVGDIVLTASATSGLLVSYSSDDENVAMISGNTLSIIGAGLVTITASQSGDDDYEAATPIDHSFTVNQAEQTIASGSLTCVTFGDVPFALGASANSGLSVSYLSSDTDAIVGNTVTIVGAGTTTVTASQAGDTNYEAGSKYINLAHLPRGIYLLVGYDGKETFQQKILLY